MSSVLRWVLVAAVLLVIGVAPVVYYRSVYAHNKRLRVVTPGKMYRSGQLTAVGFEDAIHRYGIRMIVNLQDDYPDPKIAIRFRSSEAIRESALCDRLGVRFLTISPDLISRKRVGTDRPHAIDDLLKVLDDEANYPILIHCKAGLHRTGILAAVYRMEYEGWSKSEAYRELKAHGFGDWACTAANDYVEQYVLTFRRGMRRDDDGFAAVHKVRAGEP